MRGTLAMLVILTTGGLSVAFADPPTTPVAPESRSTTSKNSTAEDNTGQHSASQTAPATAAAPAAETPAGAPANSAAAKVAESPAVAPANPTAATVAETPDVAPASDERMEEKQLLNRGYKPGMRNGEKVFCKREAPIGSRLPSELHCLTVAEAEMMAKEGRETAERKQRAMTSCLSSGGARGANCGS